MRAHAQDLATAARMRDVVRVVRAVLVEVAAIAALYPLLLQVVRLLNGRDVTAVGVAAGVFFTALAGALALVPGRRDFWRGVGVGSASVACLALAALALVYGVAGRGGPSVSIAQPREGDIVVVDTVVRGSFSRLSDDERVWVAVVPLGLDQELFFPQNGPAASRSRGRWEATALVGRNDPNDAGRAFKLVAFVADRAADERLTAYLTEGRTTGSFPGLDRLPEGVKATDEVIVRRRA